MTASGAELDNRLIDLEIRLAHQEAAIDQLTRQLIERDREIRQLTARLTNLERQLYALVRFELANPAEETPPPHY